MAIRTIADTFAAYDRAVAGFIGKFDRVNQETNATIEKLKNVPPRGALNKAGDVARTKFLVELLNENKKRDTDATRFIETFSFIDFTDSQAKLIRDEADTTQSLIQVIIGKIAAMKDQDIRNSKKENIDFQPLQITQSFEGDLRSISTKNQQLASTIDNCFRGILQEVQRMLNSANNDRVINAALGKFNQQKMKLQYHSISLNQAVTNCKGLNQRQKDFFTSIHKTILRDLQKVSAFINKSDSRLGNEKVEIRPPLDLDAQGYEKTIIELFQSSSVVDAEKQELQARLQAIDDDSAIPTRQKKGIKDAALNMRQSSSLGLQIVDPAEEVSPQETDNLMGRDHRDRRSCCCFGL